MNIRSWIAVVALHLACIAATAASADPGTPVAVQWWGQAMVSIETYWGFTVVIDPYGDRVGYQNPGLTGDLVLVTHEHTDHNNVQAVGGKPIVVRGLDENGDVRAVHNVLDRLPNQDRPIWLDADAAAVRSTHEITVRTVAAYHDDEQGSARGKNAMFVVDVDGVRIVHCGDLGQLQLTDAQIAALGSVDVLLLPVGGIYTIDGRQAADIVRQVAPRIVIPVHYKTPALAFDLHKVGPFIDALDAEVTRVGGNTLAVAATTTTERPAKTKLVVLGYEPWQPTGELAELFARKEAVSRDSQAVYAALSANQMNFRPSNGTHTPRWNAEHMMGRELLFFTQIYAALDPAFTPIDLNPAQMPPDYQAAHPEWSGAEEARQMERAGAFVRRFAYLLDGVDLDQPAPGSRWTLRRLFEQMERHYSEHTANVKKKFALPGWPSE